MTIEELKFYLQIGSIVLAVFSLLGVLFWKSRSNRLAIKKDVLIDVGGAMHSQVLTVMMACRLCTIPEAQEVFEKNNRIFGRMYVVANDETNKQVLCFVGKVAAYFSIISKQTQLDPSDEGALNRMKQSTYMIAELIALIPPIIAQIKKELRIKGSVAGLTHQIDVNNSMMIKAVEELLPEGATTSSE